MLAHTYTHMWTNAYVENLNNSNYCDINMALFFFSPSRLTTVHFSILMSRIQNIWPQPVSTLGRHWGGLGEDFGEDRGDHSPLGASSHLSWSLVNSQLCAAVIQYWNTRICCHWKSSLFPVASELKFPHRFSKKKKKKLSEEADVKVRNQECDCKWEIMTFSCLNRKNSFTLCWGVMTSSLLLPALLQKRTGYY